jgi:hypothetical protein
MEPQEKKVNTIYRGPIGTQTSELLNAVHRILNRTLGLVPVFFSISTHVATMPPLIER